MNALLRSAYLSAGILVGSFPWVQPQTCAALPAPFSFTRSILGRGYPFDGDRPISTQHDYNGDGVFELAIGESTFSYAEVAIHDGLNGNIIRQYYGPDDGSSNFIESVSVAPDINGDGLPEVLVGDPLVFPRGRAFFFSTNSSGPIEGAERLLYQIHGPGPDSGFGNDTAVLGNNAAIAWSDESRVRIIDLATGATRAQISGRTSSGFGFFLSVIGDVDGDGVDDWLTADPNVFTGDSQRGQAYVLRGSVVTSGPGWTPIDSLPPGALLATLQNEGSAKLSYGISRNGTFASMGDPNPQDLVRERLIVGGGIDGFLVHKLTESAPGTFVVRQVAYADQHTSEFVRVTYIEGLGDVNYDGVGDWAMLDDVLNLVFVMDGHAMLDGFQESDILQTIEPAPGDGFISLSCLQDYDSNGSVDLLIGRRVNGSGADILYDIYSANVPEPTSAWLAGTLVLRLGSIRRRSALRRHPSWH